MQTTQTHRLMAVSSPLGKDVLLLQAMTVKEELSRPFEIHLDLLSEDPYLAFEDIVGENMTVRLEVPEGETRYFNGFVSDFSQTSTDVLAKYARYQATLVPWLWFFTRSTDCRVFQNRRVPDIIMGVLKERGFDKVNNRLHDEYAPRSYCVQYRETDFHFVSRLMEEEGIYYYFHHQNGSHELVLVESTSYHDTVSGYEKIPFYAEPENVSAHRGIYRWTPKKSVQPGWFKLKDFDFTKPKSLLSAQASISREHANAEYEMFDYPGEYSDLREGERLARIRMEEMAAKYRVIMGSTNARGLSTGYTFELIEHPREEQNDNYLVTSTVIRARSDEYTSTDKAPSELPYQCDFTVVPVTAAYRPARKTPKTFVRGPQTAIVVGPTGDEIHTDKYGRVKVQFHWDRVGNNDENSSCWIRVAQSCAGKKWGIFSLPRIGQEVIVEFLEGDPDCPIITGSVHNAETMPPYPLPAEKTKSTIKSNSSKGGKGFNEIRFEDKKGEEQIFMHAEKNQDIRVKNDGYEWIGNDRHLHVINNQFEKVDVDQHIEIAGNQLEKVAGDKNVTVDGSVFNKIGGDHNLSVIGSRMTAIKGDDHLDIKGDLNIKSGGNVSVQANQNKQEKAGQKYAMEAGTEIHFKAGMKAIIEAGTQLTLKVGGNFIDINPGGVFIKGTMVMINSGGAAGAGGGSSPTAPAAAEEPEPPEAPIDAAEVKAGGTAAAYSAKDEEKQKGSLTSTKVKDYSPAAQVLKEAAEDGTPFCEECEKAKNKGKA